MEVKVSPPPPPPPPPTVYDITGLTEDEVVFLRDLCGRFSCTPPRGTPAHFHTNLFGRLHVLIHDTDLRYKFRTTNTSGPFDPVLRCALKGEGWDD